MEDSNATKEEVVINWGSIEEFATICGNYMIIEKRDVGWDSEDHAARLFSYYERYNKRPLKSVIFEELISRRPMVYAGAATKVFELADIENKGYLDVKSFTTACGLILRFLSSKLPKKLPEDLVPHSKRSSAPITHPERSLALEALSIDTPDQPIKNLPFFSFFEALVDDLCHEIFSFLPRTTLLDVCRLSKRLHDIGIPILYQTVKLSSILGKSSYSNRVVAKLPLTPSHTMIQQYRFAKQLIQKPDYARFVRNFIWSNELEHSDETCYPTFVDDTFFKWHPHKLPDLFALLDNINYVDIDICALYTRTAEILSYFPTARIILIRGGMPFQLLREILHGKNSTDLKRLVLNSVYDRTELCEDEMDETRRANRQPDDPQGINYDSMHWDLRVRVSESQTLYFANILTSLPLDDGPNRIYYGCTPEECALLRNWSRFLRGVERTHQISNHQRVGGEFPNPSSSPLSSDEALFRDLLLSILARLKEEEDQAKGGELLQ